MTATDVDFSDAADQCAGLRKLSMSGFACNFLGVLRVAGPTLEELKSFDMLTRGDFEKVRQLCPKLSSISLSARGDDGREVYADLPCSYGSQLRFSNLVVPTALCEKIVKSCPNLRCCTAASEGIGTFRKESLHPDPDQSGGFGSCVEFPRDSGKT